MEYTLRFKELDIVNIAEEYNYEPNETTILDMVQEIQDKKYLDYNNLQKLAYWKSPRSASNIKKNQNEYVIEISRISLTTMNDRLRIQSLTLLDGVGWPTASCILHWFHRDPYPILDFRTLWSLSITQPQSYSYEFWKEYTDICRNIVARNSINMRTLDKALWKYSELHQRV